MMLANLVGRLVLPLLAFTSETYTSFIDDHVSVNALPYDERNLAERATTNLRIMPLGDSITWGYINGGGSNGYRQQLLTDLTAAGFTVDFVGSEKSGNMVDNANQGFPGYTINQIRGVVSRGLTFKPNVITLHAATNDLNRGGSGPSNEPDSDAPNRLGLLIDDCLKAVPNAAIIVAKIIPAQNSGLTQKFNAYNNALPAIVAARVAKGSKVSLVDMSVLSPASELGDNLHPNANGYAHMGKIFAAGIVAVKDTIAAPS